MIMDYLPTNWKKLSLSKILKIKHGKNQKQVECDDGKYPILGSGGLMGYANDYLWDKPSVLIGRKGTINKPQFMDKPFWTVDTLFYTDIFKGYEPKWLYNVFQTINWYKYNEASGVPSLSASTIETIKIMVPPFEEQKKIAKILSTWDLAIELKNKEVDNSIKMKKAIVQGLFNKENLKQFKMKDLVSETRAKSTGLEEVYSVSVHKGVINQIEHLGRNYAADNTDNYNLVSFGDIVYTKSPTGEFPYGIIKQSTQATDVIVSPLYGVFKPISYNTGIIMDAYFESYINTGNYLKPIIQKGAKNTINITNSTFLEGKILFPKEKKLIDKYAQLIVNLDYKIDLLKQELKLLTKQKQGLMQQLLTGKIRVQS